MPDDDDAANNVSQGRNVLCYGGGNGVVVCRRRSVVAAAAVAQQSEQETSNSSPLAVPPATEPAVVSSKTNEWAMDDGDNGDGNNKGACAAVDDLESKLAAMETTKSHGPLKPPTTTAKEGSTAKKGTVAATTTATATTTFGWFPSFELHSLREPPAPFLRCSGDDDDDNVGIGIGGRGSDDRKIQHMLARYMAMEEDEDILAALRGGSATGSNGNAHAGGGGERDERLSAADRALWTFTDRLKRAPRQVLRYAHGGVPLWSVYVFCLFVCLARTHGDGRTIYWLLRMRGKMLASFCKSK